MINAEWWAVQHPHARWRTARKKHVCAEVHCNNIIHVGQRYFDTGELIDPSRFEMLRLCDRCANKEVA